MSEGLETDGRVQVHDTEHKKKGNRARWAAIFGFFVDMYDVYLPVIALAPAIAYFSAAGSSTIEMATLTAAIFAASLVGRPLGSVIFGPMGDKLGRRRTTVIVSAGFTVCTGLIALLPSYASIGVLSPVLLVALRLLDGVFLGGEYTAASPLAMEYAPREKRGIYGSLLNIGYPAALGFITIITIITLQVFPGGDIGSAYVVWGWRIPFVIGFVLSGMLFLYYLRSVPESELWTKMPTVKNPLRTLFSGQTLRSFGTAFIVGSGAWFTLDGTIGVFSSHFKKLGTDISVINSVVLIAAAIGICAFPLIGAAGQRYGRREVFFASWRPQCIDCSGGLWPGDQQLWQPRHSAVVSDNGDRLRASRVGCDYRLHLGDVPNRDPLFWVRHRLQSAQRDSSLLRLLHAGT